MLHSQNGPYTTWTSCLSLSIQECLGAAMLSLRALVAAHAAPSLFLVRNSSGWQKSDWKIKAIFKHFVSYRLIVCLRMLSFCQGWKIFQRMLQPAVFFWGKRCFGWSSTWAPQWGPKGMKPDSSRKETIHPQRFQLNKCFPNSFFNRFQ